MWFVLLMLMAPPEAPQFQQRVQEGVAALERGDLPSAQKSLEEASRLEASSAPAWFLLAQTYARQKNAKAALGAAQKAGELAGNDANLLYNLAVFYRDAGQFDDSISAARRAQGVENSSEVRTVLGQAFAAKQDWPNAYSEFREARKLSPYSEEAVFNEVQVHLQSQDFAGAIVVLEESRKIFDKSPQLELAFGVALYGQRKFPEAVDHFLRVMDLAPDVPQPYFFVGRILDNATARIGEVMVKAAALEKRQPQSPIGYVLHARAIILQLPAAGFPAEAEQAQALIEKALALKEDQSDAHYLMGVLLERKKDYAAAATHLERSAALNEKDPLPHFRLARVYDRLGRKEEAATQRLIHEKLSNEEGGQANR